LDYSSTSRRYFLRNHKEFTDIFENEIGVKLNNYYAGFSKEDFVECNNNFPFGFSDFLGSLYKLYSTFEEGSQSSTVVAEELVEGIEA